MTRAATTPTHLHTSKCALRAKIEVDSLLFSFVCQCRGVKFYDLQSTGRRWGTKLSLVREPTNLRDPLCVTGLDVTIFCLRHEYIHIYIVYMGDSCIAGITP